MTVYKPEKNLKTPIAVCIACVIAGITVFLMGGMGIGWRLGMQLAGLILLVTAVEISTKFIFSSYTYEISVLAGGGADLVVTKIGGTRSMVVCNIGADSVVCIVKKEKLGEFEKKYGRMDVRYNYYANFGTSDVVWVHFIHNDKKALVAIEANEEFYAELRKYFISEGEEV